MAKKVAVIGAGASGLPATKCCIDEGLEPTCFERTNALGGLWNFTEEVRPGQACVMRSTVINTSKEMMCYSDYPIPKEFPNFMPNRDVLRYFQLYAKHFNLEKYIQYNTEVLNVKRTSDFARTGQWEVVTRKKGSDDTEKHVFDAVMVCTGHHANVNMPKFKGLETFKGKVVHSHDYKDFRGMEGKRIVVVGIGNSGGDIIVELSRIASKVYCASRRGSWIFNRVDDNGLPWDLTFSTRRAMMFARLFPNLNLKMVKSKLNKRFDHKMFSLQPKHDPFQQHPTANDDLPNRIIEGSIVIKTNIREISGSRVIFEDGTSEDNIDAIVMATGYIFGFPFVEKGVVDVQKNKVELFKYCFPPDLAKQTLCVIGCFQPIGAIMPAAELECRLAVRVFKGTARLPSREKMWEDIRMKQEAMAKRYTDSTRHTIQVDWVPFMDELAALNNCKPNMLKLVLTDPVLAYHVFFGPCTPYQYRLHGPRPWAGARQAIMTTMDRVMYPLKTRPLGLIDKDSSNSFLYFIAMGVLAVIIYWVFSLQ